MTVFHCSQTNSNRIFHLILNRPSCDGRSTHTCKLALSISTHAHATYWYTTAFPQERKTSCIHCHTFSLLRSVMYSGWLTLAYVLLLFVFWSRTSIPRKSLQPARLTWIFFYWGETRRKRRADNLFGIRFECHWKKCRTMLWNFFFSVYSEILHHLRYYHGQMMLHSNKFWGETAVGFVESFIHLLNAFRFASLKKV